MKFKHISKVAVVVLAVILLAGCTGGSAKKARIEEQSQVELQEYAKTVLNDEEMKLFQVPFALNDELKKEAKSVYDMRGSKMENAKVLALYLLREGGGLGITYSRNCNYTAVEVAERREANCISYTNLYIGMARAVGIQANYAEVTQVDSFDRVGGTVVYNSHVCAVVFHGPQPYLVDFSLRAYPQYHSWRAISDLEATASFLNNKGSFYLLKDTSVESNRMAEKYFNMALKLFPTYVQAYNNLGVVRLREGRIDKAEELYRKAMEIRPGYFASYTNLSKVYLSRGQMDKAIELMLAAVKAEPQNLYAYTSLANLYINTNNYSEAERVLKEALDREKHFTEARHELGRLYLRMGEDTKAREQFALALKYQPDDNIAKNKMELIEQLTLNRNKVRIP